MKLFNIGNNRTSCDLLNMSISQHIIDGDNVFLTRKLLLDKIKVIIFNMDISSTRRPDFFFHAYWEIIWDDVISSIT